MAANTLKPFHTSCADAALNNTQTKALNIGSGNGEITRVEDTSLDGERIWTACGGKGEIIIWSFQPCVVAIFDLNGRSVYRKSIGSDENVRISVPQGCLYRE